MIEDFLNDPKGELKWLGWALLLLISLTFGAALVYSAVQFPTLPGVMSHSAVEVAGVTVEIASTFANKTLAYPLYGLVGIVALFIARNFLSAFRHHRPRLMAVVGILPLYLIALSNFQWGDDVVLTLTAMAVIWALLLPIPRSGQHMRQSVRGVAVGLPCALFYELGGVVVAAAYAGWMLYRRRPIEAAFVGLAAAAPPMLIVGGVMAEGNADGNTIAYGLMLSVVLVEGFIGILIDTFAPETEAVEETPPEPEEPGEPSGPDRRDWG